MSSNPGYRLANRYSIDSVPGVDNVESNVSSMYGKDVLPLPIEIPDNVADADAFRRYLSVRRRAITPGQNIAFENSVREKKIILFCYTCVLYRTNRLLLTNH